MDVGGEGLEVFDAVKDQVDVSECVSDGASIIAVSSVLEHARELTYAT